MPETINIEVSSEDSKSTLLDNVKNFFKKIAKAFETDEYDTLPANYVTTKAFSYDELFTKLRSKWALQMGLPMTKVDIYRHPDKKNKLILGYEIKSGEYEYYKVALRTLGSIFGGYKYYGYAEIR